MWFMMNLLRNVVLVLNLMWSLWWRPEHRDRDNCQADLQNINLYMTLRSTMMVKSFILLFLRMLSLLVLKKHLRGRCGWKLWRKNLSQLRRLAPWTCVLPKNKKAISVRWIFKTKLKPDGSIAKCKESLVARGFLQKLGLDYFEVFAPVAKHETIRLVIAITTSRNWSLLHLDIKSAFLNGPLQEEVYVT